MFKSQYFKSCIFHCLIFYFCYNYRNNIKSSGDRHVYCKKGNTLNHVFFHFFFYLCYIYRDKAILSIMYFFTFSSCTFFHFATIYFCYNYRNNVKSSGDRHAYCLKVNTLTNVFFHCLICFYFCYIHRNNVRSSGDSHVYCLKVNTLNHVFFHFFINYF